MSVVVVGTSRLHEPSEVAASLDLFEPIFLKAGYFHSPRQIADLLDVGIGSRDLSADIRRYFFRRDGLPMNRFDEGLWDADEMRGREAVKRLRSRFLGAEAFLIEISSLQEYRLEDVSLQGNPNAKLSVPYAEVWREGYYHHYDPSLGVRVENATVEESHRALERICALAQRPIFLMSHLVGTDGGIPARQQLFAVLRESVVGLPVKLIDTRDIVDRFGFRILPDGSTDPHHLPVAGCEALAVRISETLGTVR